MIGREAGEALDRRALGGAVALVCCLLFTCGAVAGGWQAFNWLKTGGWYPLSLGWAFDEVGARRPFTTMAGLNKIIDWVPLSLTLVILSLVVFCAALIFFDAYDESQK